MKKKFLFIFLFAVLITTVNVCLGSEKFSYGFKIGLSNWKMMSLTETLDISNSPKNFYPIGISICGLVETELFSNFFLISELAYQRKQTEITVYTGYDTLLRQRFIAQYLSLPILFKYQFPRFFKFYTLTGPCLGYLLKSKYEVSEFDIIFETSEITNALPKFDNSIIFGIGKKIDISKLFFIFEMRGQLGLTKYNYYEIGKWRNMGLQLLFGLQFK